MSTSPKKSRYEKELGEFDRSVCILCQQSSEDEEVYGKMLKKAGITVHYFCMLFSSGLSQNGASEKEGVFGFLPEDILKEVKRGSRLKCIYCKKKGATIGCVVKSCRKVFHFGCGRKSSTLHQFFDTYRSNRTENALDNQKTAEGKHEIPSCEVSTPTIQNRLSGYALTRDQPTSKTATPMVLNQVSAPTTMQGQVTPNIETHMTQNEALISLDAIHVYEPRVHNQALATHKVQTATPIYHQAKIASTQGSDPTKDLELSMAV